MRSADAAPTAVEQASQVVAATYREFVAGKLTGDGAAETLRADVELFVLLWEERVAGGDMEGAFAALTDFATLAGRLLAATTLIAAGALSTLEATSGVAGETLLSVITQALDGGLAMTEPHRGQ